MSKHMNGQSYSVLLRDVQTGEVREAKQTEPWGDTTLYRWTAGNMECDCNRETEFRAGTPIDPDPLCGNVGKRYTLEAFVFDEFRVRPEDLTG